MPIYVPGKVTLAKDYVEGDRYFSNVSLLLHGDGANGSQTIIDSSPSPKIITAFPAGATGAKINTTVTDPFGRTGVGVLAVDGTGDYFNIGDGTSPDDDFGSNDFTMEAWVYKVGGSISTILAKRFAAASSGWLFAPEEFSANIGGVWRQSVITATFTAGTWRHVALTRSGNTFRIFHSGVIVGTYTQSGVLDNRSGTIMRVGVAGGTTEVLANAYYDDIRITRGVARYVANFTPPTAPFADAQY